MARPGEGYREWAPVDVNDRWNGSKEPEFYDNKGDVMSEIHKTRTREVLAAGVSSCPGGWAAAIERSDGVVEVAFDESFERLVRGLRDRGARVIAVGVPIGLPERPEFRRCDKEARDRLGERKNSAFPVPDRELLTAATYEEAKLLVAKRKGHNPSEKGISLQSYNTGKKSMEVDVFVRANPDCHAWLVEVHTEVSFYSMAADALPKRASREGAMRREALLRRELKDVDLPKDLPSPGKAQRVQVLSALAALWSARRFADKRCVVLGGDLDANGVPMRMIV